MKMIADYRKWLGRFFWLKGKSASDKSSFAAFSESIFTGRWNSGTQVVVTFSGGIGAQILSAAAYFRLSELGFNVAADMSYFDLYKGEDRPLMSGGLSYWPWNLDFLGISRNSFTQYPTDTIGFENPYRLRDDALKLEIAIDALKYKSVADRFRVPEKVQAAGSFPELPESYGAIHIRRGDYLNVASHIVSNEMFLKQLKSVSKLTDNCVLVSDSKISDEIKDEAQDLFNSVWFFDDSKYPETVIFRILKNAKILITSNSQFSLTAALLSSGVTLIPKKWFEGDSSLDLVVDKLGEYQLLSL